MSKKNITKKSLKSTRIVTFDGGGQLAFLTIILLQQIEKERPGFLKSIDCFGGTSAGAILALILASEEDPADKLETCINLWEKMPTLFNNSPWGTALSFTGFGALYSGKDMESYLSKTNVLGKKTLNDLPKRVAIHSFKLSDMLDKNKNGSWTPVVFTNFGKGKTQFGKVSAVEIAMRSSAAPLSFPIRNGYVDGGVFANNPAVSTLSVVLEEIRAENNSEHSEILNSVKLLSVGVGKKQENHPHLKNNNMGLLQWIANPRSPLLIFDLLMEANAAASTFEARHVLPESNFFRLNPFYTVTTFGPFVTKLSELRDVAKSIQTHEQINACVDWIDGTKWFNTK